MTPMLVAIAAVGCLLLFRLEEGSGTRRGLSGYVGEDIAPEGLREVFPTLPEHRRVCRYRLAGIAGAPACCENEFECNACHVHGRLALTRLDCMTRLCGDREVSGFRFDPSCFYHRGHTWARIESGGFIWVGADSMVGKLAQHADHVVLPEVESFVEQSEPAFTVVLSGGESLPMLSPISGEVMAVNQMLLSDPYAMHRPEESWTMVVRPFQIDRELQNLLFGAEALAWFQAEVRALQGMVAEPGFAADGGEFRVAAGMVFPWRTFVTQFLLSA